VLRRLQDNMFLQSRMTLVCAHTKLTKSIGIYENGNNELVLSRRKSRPKDKKKWTGERPMK